MEGKASDIISSDHFLLQTGPQRVLEECLRSAQRKGSLSSPCLWVRTNQLVTLTTWSSPALEVG